MAYEEVGGTDGTKMRGFGSMTRERHRQVASDGGKAVHEKGKAYKFTPAKAREAGSLGGKKTSLNVQHMAEIGRKGGKTAALKRKSQLASAEEVASTDTL